MVSGDIGQLFRRFAVPGILGLLFIGMQPKIPMKYIASYLGVTAQSLSRIRASLI